jgi:type I restriction enzyme S subunit
MSEVGWRQVEIGTVATVIGGGTPNTRDPGNFDGDVPWVTPKDLSAEHDRYVAGGSRTLSSAGLASSSAKVLPKRAVLLSTRAPIGYVALAARELTTNQGFRSLVARPGIDPEFLYYWLKANRDVLERHANGSTFRELSGGALKKITIWMPSCLAEQRRVSGILASLDNKIELIRRMNRTLEDLAQAIFKSWFIDFDGHHDLVDSEIGPVPTGWEVKPIGDAVKVVGGSTPSTKEPAYWEGGTHAWATPKDLSGLAVPVLLGTERQVTDAGLQQISSGLLPAGTFLLSSRAPIGYTAISQVPTAINQGFIAIPPGGELTAAFLLFWTRFNMDGIKGRAGGTTFAEISKAAFRPIPVGVPPRDRLGEFERTVGPLLDRIVANARESATLTGLRDTLLPKLISGELRVPEAEELVEAAS